MWAYIARRTLYMVPVLLVVTVVVFALITLIPGTYMELVCGLGCPNETRDRLYEQYGLNDPVYYQYAHWLHGLVGGPHVDATFPFVHFEAPTFGNFLGQRPAFEILLGDGRGMWTLVMLLSAMGLSWLVGVPAGVYAATHKHALTGRLFAFLSTVGMSVPSYILGLLFIWWTVWQMGGIYNPFFQIGGFLNPEYVGQPLSAAAVLNFLWHFGPPVVLLAVVGMANVVLQTRGRMLEVLELGYVQTARAKGLKERKVIRHALRNAINPLISMLGIWLPAMMEGLMVIALVFSLPVAETAFLGAIQGQNTVVILCGIFLFTLLVLVGNLVADLLLALSDPTIRYE